MPYDDEITDLQEIIDPDDATRVDDEAEALRLAAPELRLRSGEPEPANWYGYY